MNNISLRIALIAVAFFFSRPASHAQTIIPLDKRAKIESVAPNSRPSSSTLYTDAELARYQSYITLAYKALLQDSLTQAAHHFTQAAELLPNHPSNAEVYYQLGILAEADKNFSKADTYYSKSLKIDPALAKSQERRGAVAIQLEQYQQAADHYSKYLAMQPNDNDARFIHGYALLQLNQVDQALAEYLRVTKADSLHANALMGIAIIHQRQGHLQQALEEMNALLARHHENAAFYQIRSEIEITLGHNEAALYDLNRAIELEPRNPIYYLKRADYYFHTDNTALAQADLNRARHCGATKAQTDSVINNYSKQKR